jgi:hypothetical protein
MGAWGVGAFDNDTAADFLADLEEWGSSLVIRTLRFVADVPEHEYLDPTEAEKAVAGAELVAGARSHGNPTSPAEAIMWAEALGEAADETVVDLALRALSRVIADESDLKDCWEESGKGGEWRADIDDLVFRLLQSKGRQEGE